MSYVSGIKIYSDGACAGNPGLGGWAAIVLSGNHQRELSGAEANTTNQRMEMRAALEGLRSLVIPRPVVHLYSDSAYLVDGFLHRWYRRWQANGWKTVQEQPVKNRDLWEALIAESERHRITWHKVRGHSGDPLNDRADQLAVAARKTLDPRRGIQ